MASAVARANFVCADPIRGLGLGLGSSTMLLDLLLGGAVSAGIFWCCRLLLRTKLYSDLECLSPRPDLPQPANAPKLTTARTWHSALAESCFSLCFTECCVLFVMLMCQGIGLLALRARYYIWSATLLLLLSTIIVLLPTSFCVVLTYRGETPNLYGVRAMAFLFPVTAFVFALSFIPLPADLTTRNPLAAATARLVVLGTTVLGLLSGLGSVSAAWSAFTHPTHVAPLSLIASTANALDRVKSDLQERTQGLNEYVASKPPPPTGESWMSRLSSKRDTHLDSLQQEIVGLEALESQMTSRILALKRQRETAAFAQSFRGRWLGRTWAVYCVCRVFSSVINLLSPPTLPDGSSSYGDVIAHVLAYLLSLLPLDSGTRDGPGIDVPSLSRQISLALVGVIILSSIRVVLINTMRIFRITSRSMSASLMLLFLAQLMGIYLLSTVVQLRTMFPASPSPGDPFFPDGPTDGIESNLLFTLPEFSLFGGLFDWSFLVGAGGYAVVRWASGCLDESEMD